MQKSKFRSCLQMLSVLLLTAFVSVSCIKEDLSECAKPGFSLQAKAFDAEGLELGNEDVKHVTLYIFDKNKLFLDTCEILLQDLVMLDYPGHKSLTVVAWGNGKLGNQKMPTLEKGQHLETAFVSLIKNGSKLPVAGLPDDLFYGSIDIHADEFPAKVLPIKRKIASVIITARNLKGYVGHDEGDFRYVVRKKNDKIDFYGKPGGDEVNYVPPTTFNEKGDLVSPVFNIFPTESELKIDIYHQNVLKATVSSDSEGKPLRVAEGKLLNVFINFREMLSVEMKVTDWDKIEIWKEFKH